MSKTTAATDSNGGSQGAPSPEVPDLVIAMMKDLKRRRAAETAFKVLGSPHRLRILAEVAKAHSEKAPRTMSSIGKAVKLSASAMSQHVDKLEKAGFVKRTRQADRAYLVDLVVPKLEYVTKVLVHIGLPADVAFMKGGTSAAEESGR